MVTSGVVVFGENVQSGTFELARHAKAHGSADHIVWDVLFDIFWRLRAPMFLCDFHRRKVVLSTRGPQDVEGLVFVDANNADPFEVLFVCNRCLWGFRCLWVSYLCRLVWGPCDCVVEGREGQRAIREGPPCHHLTIGIGHVTIGGTVDHSVTVGI